MTALDLHRFCGALNGAPSGDADAQYREDHILEDYFAKPIDVSRTCAQFQLSLFSGMNRLLRGEVYEAIRTLAAMRGMITPFLCAAEDRTPFKGTKNYERRLKDPNGLMRMCIPQAYSREECLMSYCIAAELYDRFNHTREVEDKDVSSAVSSTRLFDCLLAQSSREPCSANVVRSSTIEFVTQIACALERDCHWEAVGIGGSWLVAEESNGPVGPFDSFSDLDIYLVGSDAHHPKSLEMLRELPAGGEAYRAEVWLKHNDAYYSVLYGPSPIKVDYRIYDEESLMRRWENPEIIWSRTKSVRDLLVRTAPNEKYNAAPQPTFPMIEKIFWLAVVELCGHLSRGEFLRSVGVIDDLRGQVFGPLVAKNQKLASRGARRLERRFPEMGRALESSVAPYGSLTVRSLGELINLFAVSLPEESYPDLKRMALMHYNQLLA